LSDLSVSIIVVKHRDRLTRFGFHYIETFLTSQGRKIEVVNLANNSKDELMEDLVSIVYSFSARMYGQRRAKRKTEIIVETLKAQDDAVS
jgi:predicted site-specific integrase-resolvase